MVSAESWAENGCRVNDRQLKIASFMGDEVPGRPFGEDFRYAQISLNGLVCGLWPIPTVSEGGDTTCLPPASREAQRV